MKTLKEKYYVYGIICIYIIIFAVFHESINTHFPISLDKCSELTKMIVEALLPPVAIGSATYLLKLISIIFVLRGDKYSVLLKTSHQWLLSANVHWAATHGRLDRKIANTSEGLACFTYTFNSIGNLETKIIRDCLDYLTENASEKGLKSFSMDIETVQCTALALYAIARIQERHIFQLSDSHKQIKEHLKTSLLTARSAAGWGTTNKKIENESQMRTITTLWALRALNVDGDNDEIVSDTIMQIIRKVPDGLIGYRLNDHPKLSATALFLTVIFEIKNTNLKAEILNRIPVVKLLNFVLGKIEKEIIETENYLTDGMGLPSAIEFLPYHHFGFGYALSAIALSQADFNIYQRLVINRRISKIISKHITKQGNFSVSVIASNVNDPYTYPTAYFIMGLYDFINNYIKTKHENN